MRIALKLERKRLQAKERQRALAAQDTGGGRKDPPEVPPEERSPIDTPTCPVSSFLRTKGWISAKLASQSVVEQAAPSKTVPWTRPPLLGPQDWWRTTCHTVFTCFPCHPGLTLYPSRGLSELQPDSSLDIFI